MIKIVVINILLNNLNCSFLLNHPKIKNVNIAIVEKIWVATRKNKLEGDEILAKSIFQIEYIKYEEFIIKKNSSKNENNFSVATFLFCV